jgi:hypothetical protein
VQSRQHAIWYYKEVSDSSLGLNLGTFLWFLLIFLDSSLIHSSGKFIFILCSSNKLRFVMFCDDEIVLVLVLVLALT